MAEAAATENISAIDIKMFQKNLVTTPTEPITLPRPRGNYVVDKSVIEDMYCKSLSSYIPTLEALGPKGIQLFSHQ